MEAVKKAASGAVESIRNSPLLRRKFGTYQKAATRPPESEAGEGEGGEAPRPLSPEKDTTPFVQGFYFQVEYLGKHLVDAGRAQDHGCTDEAVRLFWDEGRSNSERDVSVRITTTNIRVKRSSDAEVLYDYPLFRVSYCGTDKVHKEVFSFVAKESDGRYGGEGMGEVVTCGVVRFYCFVFRSANKEKSYAIALTVAKAFYLAYQILQEQQGKFPPTPERETLFEPQRADDTKVSPLRPVIPLEEERHTQADLMDFTDQEAGGTPTAPRLRVSHPSQTSLSDCENITAAVDEDFTRLAKARSNPNILRSTLEHSDITGGNMTLVHLHTDPGSTATTPLGSPHSTPHISPHSTPHGSQEDLRDI